MATRLQNVNMGFVNQAVDKGTDLLADRIEHYVNVGHEVCNVMRQRGESQPAEMLEGVIGRVNTVSTYLRNADGTQLFDDVQDFARGRTWLLAGVGFMGGLLAARTVRAANGGAGTYDIDGATYAGQTPYVEQFDQDRAYGRT